MAEGNQGSRVAIYAAIITAFGTIIVAFVNKCLDNRHPEPTSVVQPIKGLPNTKWFATELSLVPTNKSVTTEEQLQLDMLTGLMKGALSKFSIEFHDKGNCTLSFNGDVEFSKYEQINDEYVKFIEKNGTELPARFGVNTEGDQILTLEIKNDDNKKESDVEFKMKLSFKKQFSQKSTNGRRDRTNVGNN